MIGVARYRLANASGFAKPSQEKIFTGQIPFLIPTLGIRLWTWEFVFTEHYHVRAKRHPYGSFRPLASNFVEIVCGTTLTQADEKSLYLRTTISKYLNTAVYYFPKAVIELFTPQRPNDWLSQRLGTYIEFCSIQHRGYHAMVNQVALSV